MLSKRLTIKEWGCVGVLAAGVTLVESSQAEIVSHHASNVIGILSVVFACLSSGLAGVYFEKILKSSRSNIWMINMQMSLLSAFFCTVRTMNICVDV
ncbi:nucleotide-sugar transporter [Ochromonadaceae sp. CCMP2298]|nr:nucleotide-sugar transporter [Ochromonadaceae sp. CCMP2298]